MARPACTLQIKKLLSEDDHDKPDVALDNPQSWACAAVVVVVAVDIEVIMVRTVAVGVDVTVSRSSTSRGGCGQE